MYPLTSSFNTLSSSYHNDSASFDSRINSATPYKISSGSVSVTTYADGKVIAVSGSKDGGIHFTVSGSGSFTGTVDAASFYQNSLRALKENIHPFTASAVELINDLDIVTFNYKRLPNLFKIGIIAHDSHEYIATKEHNSLDTTNSIGLLLKAIQELYRDNCELRRIIEKDHL